jgi:hypothetical protein
MILEVTGLVQLGVEDPGLNWPEKFELAGFVLRGCRKNGDKPFWQD